ncbi:MAG: anthranilate synthase component I [Armatimonadetes bacterium]|nr:anthranilate synthase component I [Armatimonadota bacterium]
MARTAYARIPATPVTKYVPDKPEFIERARRGNLIPVYREILADMETPVSAFRKVGPGHASFLLESVEGGERIARYSFIGSDPFCILKTKGKEAFITEDGIERQVGMGAGSDPLHLLKDLLSRYTWVGGEELPPFSGGAVGYIGYDTIRFFEDIPDTVTDDQRFYDCVFLLTDSLLIFDHVQHRLKVLVNARVDGDPEEAYARATAKIEEIIALLKRPAPLSDSTSGSQRDIQMTPNVPRHEFEAAVERCKEYIRAGDVIQVVLSQRLSAPVKAHPFDIYRALRSLNPSPYMYYLSLGDMDIVGSSPEILVREQQGTVTVRPIAGTRPRGRSTEEDHALETELLADEKELAEHIMLVDLGRNDIGRVCHFGSVQVDNLMTIERYSHVMHIVSNVIGQLRSSNDSFDVLRATFPAGTVSGAPKIRAMEIIDELETTRRGPYAGALGYISFSGDMDMAITIRTILIKDGVATVQAGAGIVADSVPEREHQECMNKARALLRALEVAEAGLE